MMPWKRSRFAEVKVHRVPFTAHQQEKGARAGRQIVRGKRGKIPAICQPVLERLGLDRHAWCGLVRDFGKLFHRVAGSKQSIARNASDSGLGYRRSSGGPSLLSD